jgi:hypothetical protein
MGKTGGIRAQFFSRDQKGAKIEFNLPPSDTGFYFNFKELRGNCAFPWFLENPDLHPLGGSFNPNKAIEYNSLQGNGRKT